MSGILNTKQRILDTILTQEGRRQLASGELRFNFVTFTDNATFYKKDVHSGSADATERIYLEACNLPQDQITFESNDGGKLAHFIGSDEFGYKILNGKIISGSSSTYMTSSITNIAHKLLDSSLTAFTRLQSIGSVDAFFEDNTFELSDNDIGFDINNNVPFKKNNGTSDLSSILIHNAEGIINDHRSSRMQNFQYLPPINKNQQTLIGDYPKTKSTNQENIKLKIISNIHAASKRGHVKTINFLESSRHNNIFAQFFEIQNNEINKLDIIDFGILNKKRYIFVGKVFFDQNNLLKFINLFTLVFEL
tara:strand:- start:422 stop:1342 length:921 start_codon:yes stop_codon:yes gene_type:complete